MVSIMIFKKNGINRISRNGSNAMSIVMNLYYTGTNGNRQASRFHYDAKDCAVEREI